MPEIHAHTSKGLAEAAAQRLSSGVGCAAAVYRRWMDRGEFCPEQEDMTERSAAAWRREFSADLPPVIRRAEECYDGEYGRTVTAKAVLQLADGAEIECVHIPRGRNRFSLCISSQVGCKMACSFCETGRMGLVRQLTAAEIIAQVLVARHVLNWQVDNIVFMGMGEALDNQKALLQSLSILTDDRGLAFAAHQITVCTVGHVPGIRALAQAGFTRLGLAVSLNAARDDLRSQLMPINQRWPLAELQAALMAYRPRKNAQLAVHYCLLPGMNDSTADAQAIADFLQPLGRSMLNLIPFNPGRIALTRAPEEDEVVRFIALLRSHGVRVRRRIVKGRSVMAACGQLGDPSKGIRARRANEAITTTT